MLQVRSLAELSGLVVGTIVDEDGTQLPSENAFARALRRYREAGAPPETGAPWRRLLPSRSRSLTRAAAILRRATRDLLDLVANAPTEVSLKEQELDLPPANVRSIGEAPGAMPVLDRAPDGAWRPVEGPVVPVEDAIEPRQRAHVVARASRYPDPATVARFERSIIPRDERR